MDFWGLPFQCPRGKSSPIVTTTSNPMRNNLQNQIRSTIRRAIYATLGIPLLAVPIALGQQATNQVAAAKTEKPVKMEKTVVTGSLIPTAETVGPAPVQAISIEDVQKA